MLPHQLDRIRTKSADMTRSFFAATKGIWGGVSVAHAARGSLKEIRLALIAQYGEQEAYRILSEEADAVINDRAVADQYLSACLGGIIKAAQNPKRQ